MANVSKVPEREDGQEPRGYPNRRRRPPRQSMAISVLGGSFGFGWIWRTCVSTLFHRAGIIHVWPGQKQLRQYPYLCPRGNFAVGPGKVQRSFSAGRRAFGRAHCHREMAWLGPSFAQCEHLLPWWHFQNVSKALAGLAIVGSASRATT